MRVVFITPTEGTVGFEPIMWLRTQEMIRTLRDLGVEVLPIDVNAFTETLRRNSTKIAKLKSDFLIAPNFNYFLLATGGSVKILEMLETPIVALWDDPLGALALFINRTSGWFAKTLEQISRAIPNKHYKTTTGSLIEKLDNRRRRFQIVMRHPLMRHFSWDSGHIEALNSLGILKVDRVQWYPIATFSPFLKNERSKKTAGSDLGFCGNLYLGTLQKSDFFRNEYLRELTTNICREKLQSLGQPVWRLMRDEIGKIPRRIKRDLELFDDRKKFWDYYIFVVWQAANTLVRLGILQGVNRDISLYGLFADPESIDALKEYPKLKYEGVAHHFDELPEVYASTKINICVSNGLVFQGMPSKLIDCLASGGFALCDPKEDLVRFFGDIVERIFFRNVEELNLKVDYYLAHPVERDEIVTELRSKIRRQCTLEALFERVIESIKSSSEN